MTPPSVPLSVWILAGFDPVLIAIAVYLGWKADQFAKVFIAAMAALVASVLFAWALTAIGLPWFAPVGGERPMLLQVRMLGALVWAILAFGAKRGLAR